ncbi:MAG: hypothetical protein WCK37_03030 [Candidatus Falkowbacteria bacterium]
MKKKEKEVRDSLRKQLWRIPLFITVCASLPYFVAYLYLPKPYSDMVHDVIISDYSLQLSFNWFWNVPLIFLAAFSTLAMMIKYEWRCGEDGSAVSSNMELPKSTITVIAIVVGLLAGGISCFSLADNPTLAIKISVVIILVIAFIVMFVTGLSGATIFFYSGVFGMTMAALIMIIVGVAAFLAPMIIITVIFLLSPNKGEAKIFYWLAGRKKPIKGDIVI